MVTKPGSIVDLYLACPMRSQMTAPSLPHSRNVQRLESTNSYAEFKKQKKARLYSYKPGSRRVNGLPPIPVGIEFASRRGIPTREASSGLVVKFGEERSRAWILNAPGLIYLVVHPDAFIFV